MIKLIINRISNMNYFNHFCIFCFLIGVTASDATELKRDRQNSRNYLKTDYKVHISSSSTVPDHCFVFALSDTKNKYWQQICSHNHDQQ